MTYPLFQCLLVGHIWMLLLLQKIFSEVPALMLFIISNCGPLKRNAALVLEDLFGRSRIPSIVYGLISR